MMQSTEDRLGVDASDCVHRGVALACLSPEKSAFEQCCSHPRYDPIFAPRQPDTIYDRDMYDRDMEEPCTY